MKSLQEQYATSHFFAGNAEWLEQLYDHYLQSPEQVPSEWREVFTGLKVVGANGQQKGDEKSHAPLRAALAQSLRHRRVGNATAAIDTRQNAVSNFISNFRNYGYRTARLDPLDLAPREIPADLILSHYGLTGVDRDTLFAVNGFAGVNSLSLGEIELWCHRLYADTIGVEYAHIGNAERREWLCKYYETQRKAYALSADEQRQLLRRLTAAEGIERYLHTRYVGQKRFSLEGGESLTPLIAHIVEKGSGYGVEEVLIGMAHRGRLNLIVNVLGKPPRELFQIFEGSYDSKAQRGSGDVKYHLGASADIRTPQGQVHVVLAFNPSHLEAVNPVVEGSARARQERRGPQGEKTVVPILIHGDAAFSGQGVVQETLQMSATRGFSTGGTIHIICNNQIGFTTSRPDDARSSRYASDLAKFVDMPVLHVNADDPEAVVFVAGVALEYRQRFARDVMIDLVCYRRHGHNEADEPAATQPLMYKKIREHKPIRQIYAEMLLQSGVVQENEAEQWQDTYRSNLDNGAVVVEGALGLVGNAHTVNWNQFQTSEWIGEVNTAIKTKEAKSLAQKITTVPAGFSLHPRVARIMEDRQAMAREELPMDWGFAETMAYASLLNEGFHLRICGQDSSRGTFFHRHAVLHDQKNGATYLPLQTIRKEQRVAVIDSLLSEAGVLGFEYGYASTDPTTLVIWEAQFGDFVNGAQVVIDQFISSSEAKWGRLCGLVMLLPHGQEGQGPEHSSARLERFLQLCAEDNMSVCVPSTPAQMFHMLRRQLLGEQRKPLIVMTPKSLLRHPDSVSAMTELTDGQFYNVIPDSEVDPNQAERVVLCSGKIYFELREARTELKRQSIALIRVEQLYPFPTDALRQVVQTYSSVRELVWCQEEPQNQGAWSYVEKDLRPLLNAAQVLRYAGRAAAAAPAPGIFQMHMDQQQALVQDALGGPGTGK